MTISSKLVDVSGLSFAVSQDTDTIDVGGFSDSIQSVGAESAQFSDTATMEANSGLRIGMTQLKIVTIGATPGVRTEESGDFVGWSATGATVDNNNVTFTNTTSTSAVAVIDYGSVATRDIQMITRMTYVQPEFGTSGVQTFVYQISNDNITYGDPVTSSPTFQSQSVVAGGDMMGGGTIDTGIVTYNDANSQSFRYVKLTDTISGTASSPTWYIYQVTEQQTVTPEVTVRVRSSDTIDTADGTVLITNQTMGENETLTFDTELLLTGSGGFVTLEIVSLAGFDIPTTLSDITSIKEV